MNTHISTLLTALKERQITPKQALEQLEMLPEEKIINSEWVCRLISSIIGFTLSAQTKQMNLVTLGIDSIFAAKIIGEINRSCHLTLLPPVLFEFSSLQNFADYVVAKTSHAGPAPAQHVPTKSSAQTQAPIQNEYNRLWDMCQDKKSDLVFLSGLGVTQHMLYKVNQAFAKDNATQIYIPPGHAQSTEHILLRSLDDLVAHFAQFVSENKANKPLHLIGWSLGGIIAQYFTHLYPSKVESLTLVCSSVKALQDSALFSRSFDEFSSMKEKNIHLPHELFVSLSAPHLECYKTILSNFDFTGIAPHIKCPIHIINVANDKIMHLNHHAELEKHYPQAKITTLTQEDIGHFGVYTHETIFTETIKKFLDT